MSKKLVVCLTYTKIRLNLSSPGMFIKRLNHFFILKPLTITVSLRAQYKGTQKFAQNRYIWHNLPSFLILVRIIIAICGQLSTFMYQSALKLK